MKLPCGEQDKLGIPKPKVEYVISVSQDDSLIDRMNDPSQKPYSMEEAMLLYVKHVLKYTKGNIHWSCRILQISRATLYRYIEKWNLTR